MPIGRWIAVLCLLALAMLPASQGAAADDQPLIVILVRHAEKANNSADPDLSDAGRERAKQLIGVAGTAQVSAIYTTEFKRTKQTAAPLAQHLNLVPEERPRGQTSDADYAAALAKELRTSHIGRTVLVIGHTDTIPEIVAALGGSRPDSIADTEFSRLIVLIVMIVPPQGTPAVVTARYGRP